MEITKYEAQDGTTVELSAETVMRNLVPSGDRISDRQMRQFIATCQARRLNPLAGDCYLTVFKGKATVIVSKGYYERVAAQQEGYDGMESGITVINGEGRACDREGCVAFPGERVVGGWAKAYDRGRSRPSVAKVSMAEYDQHNSMWESKPATMICKVAKVQALRELYPGLFEGTYERTEIQDVPQAQPVPAEEVVEDVPEFGTDQTEEDIEG